MENSQKKTNRFPLGTIIITYVIVKIVYKLTGFHYAFSDGIANINLLIDIALWGCVYLSVDLLLKKLLSKRTV
jgi:hypothetical protein